MYIEAHGRNFEISQVKTAVDGNFAEINWDFIRGDKMNILIIKVKSDKKPLGLRKSEVINFSINGKIVK
jgi:hypothetical protein